MSAVHPFPFASLETLSRAEVAGAAGLRRFARAHVKLEEIAASMSELLGDRVSILVRRTRRLEGARGADDSVGVLIAPADDARSATKRALVEIEGALAAQIAARALKQRGPRVVDPSRPASPPLAGAVAAVLAAALRRAHAGAALRVIAAGPGHALARDLARVAPDATTASLTVLLGEAAFDARVSVPDGLTLATEVEAPLRDALLSLGDAPIAIPLVIATALASRADLASLAPGDALVPTNVAVTKAQGSNAVLGRAAIVPARGERGLGADLAPDGRLVVRGPETHSWEPPMPNDSLPTTVEVLEDAPVVVRVELGAVELAARQWAGLAPGDVITLGRKLGDAALLRVGGVEVARGELVSVDGEYAVRILARTGDVR